MSVDGGGLAENAKSPSSKNKNSGGLAEQVLKLF
jgi:hypothetical protein